MKKTQKILIMLAIFLISIVAVGCSSNEDNNTKFSNDEMKLQNQ